MLAMVRVACLTFLTLLFCYVSSLEKECPPRWFDCGNGKCISDIWRCDEDNDCGNMEDERNCEKRQSTCLSSQFSCESDGHCIPERWHCDGEKDCEDGSDEQLCDNSTVSCEGGFLCPDHHCIPARWVCDGNEDCSDGSDEVCSPASLCSDDEFLCSSGSCVNRSLVCDGNKDCSDGSDEGPHCGDPCENATCSHRCENTPSGPRCFCSSGYDLDSKDNKTCLDIDECSEEGFCSHTCSNVPGSYKCSCLDGYELVNRTCKARGADPLLIFSTLEEIRGMRLRSNRYFLIQKAVRRAAAVDADPTTQRVYWVEISNTSSVYSAKVDGTGFQTVLSHGLLIPEDIAVDYVARNLYITDSGLKQILVCKMDGRVCSVVHDRNIDRPRSVVLDSSEGFLYWSDWGDKAPGIHRSGMDGSARRHLVSADIGWPNGIAIDHTVNRLYWADAKKNTIEYITLDGSTRKVLLSGSVFHPYSLAVFEDTLYWTDWTTFSLETCNKFTGHKVTLMTRENGKHIMGVHVYHPVLAPRVTDPCWSSECSHMCLMAPSRNYRCACPPGFNLSSDGKTCTMKDLSPSLFVSEGPSVYYIRPRAVGSGAISELPLSLGAASISKVAYDFQSRTLFVADLRAPAIRAVNVTSLGTRELVRNNLVSPEDLAFDWMSNNLYWVDSSKGTVEVVSTDGLKRLTLIANADRAHALAVSQTGHMFIAADSRPSITMYDMDGKNRRILVDEQRFPMSLTVHPTKTLLYWADPLAGTISFMDYIALRPPRVLMSRLNGVMSVAVSEDYIYWTVGKRELHFRKENTTFVMQLPGQDKGTVSRKVTYTPARATLGTSMCQFRNGGCSFLCLHSPKGRTCACPPALKLADDGVSCIARSCEHGDFKCIRSSRCLPSTSRCDGKRDCDDGSDEVGCDDLCSADDFRCKNGRCILKSFHCDRRDDCSDNSDEEDCPEPAACAKDQIRCSDGECVPNLWRCDGERDCLDGTDEVGCNETRCDPDSQKRCDNGQCLPVSWFCDGSSDCQDGSDEKNCTKSKQSCSDKEFKCEDEGRCIDKRLKCDGRRDCNDGSDEKGCQNSETDCKNGMYKCKTGECIYDYEVCDGHKDCDGGEEELNCTHTLCQAHEKLCPSSKRCILKRWICDGDADCLDGSDEENCVEQRSRTPPPHAISRASDCSEFFCYITAECLPWSKVCDGHSDCEDPPDEGRMCSRSCAKGNGGCAQSCRPSPQGPNCACYSGYRLGENKKTCEDIDECKEPGTCSHFCNNTKGGFKCSCAEGYFLHTHRSCKADGGPAALVYLLGDQIRGIDLSSHTQRVYVSAKVADMRGMDYDATGRKFFFTEYSDGSINSYSLEKQEQYVIVRSETKPVHVRYDWIANNLYYTDADCNIGVCSRDGRFCTALINLEQQQPTSIDISPTTGRMFWTIWANPTRNTSTGFIERAEMDGSHRQVIVSSKTYWPMAITVDHVLQLIYWTDVNLNTLECADFHGLDRRHIVRMPMTHPFALTVFEDHVYFADWGNDTIVRCNKFNPNDCSVFHENNVKAEMIMVVHKSMQPKGVNKCAGNSCSQLCLRTNVNFTCKCVEGYIQRNGACELQPSTPFPVQGMQCSENYCLFGGTCLHRNGTPVCECPPNYSGSRCGVVASKLASTYDYSWLIAVLFAVSVVGVIVLSFMLCKRHRDKLHRVSESVSVKFRNPASHQEDHRLVLDTDDDGAATDELVLSQEGEYRRSPFGSRAYTLDPDREGDFQKWPSSTLGDTVGRFFGRLKR